MDMASTPLPLLGTSTGTRPEPLDAAARERRSGLTTVVVSMPFMEDNRPSIQLGLLKAIGTANGFPVHTLHANLDLAAQLGLDYYRALAKHRGRMVGDWLFSLEAFGTAAPDPAGGLLDDFLDELSYLGSEPDDV